MADGQNAKPGQEGSKTTSESSHKKQEKIAEETLNPSAPEDANVTPGSVPKRG